MIIIHSLGNDISDSEGSEDGIALNYKKGRRKRSEGSNEPIAHKAITKRRNRYEKVKVDSTKGPDKKRKKLERLDYPIKVIIMKV